MPRPGKSSGDRVDDRDLRPDLAHMTAHLLTVDADEGFARVVGSGEDADLGFGRVVNDIHQAWTSLTPSGSLTSAATATTLTGGRIRKCRRPVGQGDWAAVSSGG